MTKPARIGITGGIGSGKSTVCHVLEFLGLPIYNADTRGKFLLGHSKTLIEEVKKHFGTASYYPDGTLNRNFLAEHVFSKPNELKVLNALVHPAVAKDFENWCLSHANDSLVIKEAALIFETQGEKNLDAVVVVMASKSIRLQRVLMRDDQRNQKQIEDIMNQQVSDELRRKQGDYFIQNDEEQLLIPQILKIYEKLFERFKEVS